MDAPFSRSLLRPSPVESLLASIIWLHQGRANPISIADLIHLAAAYNLTLAPRQIKDLVHNLRRLHHLPIGSSRTDPPGYFIMLDPADYDAGLAAYRSQFINSAEVLAAVAPKSWLRELHGQLTLSDTAE